MTRLGLVDVVMADVEELNKRVIAGELDISKISIGVLPEVGDSYLLLNCGGAFSSEAPVVVSKESVLSGNIKQLAIPGKHTTAFLLYRKFFGCPEEIVEMRYDEIIPAVSQGKVQAGILIHEGRFTYKNYGLKLVADFGRLWKERFGDFPVPLGGVVIKKSLTSIKEDIEHAIRESISYAFEHNDEVLSFVRRYAQELDEEVIQAHIDAFVNEYTYNLGETGRKAVEFLLGSD